MMQPKVIDEVSKSIGGIEHTINIGKCIIQNDKGRK